MRLENLKEKFPTLPEEMKIMIENEVEKQMNIEHPEIIEEEKEINKPSSRRRVSARKMAMIILAATLVIGTTVAAGVKVYQLFSQKAGNYGLEIGISDSVAPTGEKNQKEHRKIPEVNIQMNYIPNGMVQDENQGSVHFESTPYIGGISAFDIIMDKTISADNLLMDKNVLYSEKLSFDGHDVVYLEKQVPNTDRIWYDKKIYVIYPEVWRVLEIFVGEDMSKEEALKVAKNIELVPTGKVVSGHYNTWSDYIKQQEPIYDEFSVTVPSTDKLKLHKIGEAFPVEASVDTPTEKIVDVDSVTAKVTDVQVSDDLHLLGNSKYVDDSYKKACDKNGKLKPMVLQYVKQGDGVDTIDEVVKTKEVAQKLVYVTIEYTNTGSEELKNVQYNGDFTGVMETTAGYELYDRMNVEEKDGYSTILGNSINGFDMLDFYDVHGGEENKNYIPSIKPGETVTVHVARIVCEDELQYMYFTANYVCHGEIPGIGELVKEFVDIRQ